MPAAPPDMGSHIASDEGADMAAELEVIPADNAPAPGQPFDTVYILSWQDCCERSYYEDTSQIPTFDNACTPREYKLQAGHADDHPYVPPPLRGTHAPNGMDCMLNDDWACQLAYDDCVITHAPDIA
eukprot:5173834-Pyramimonas_sp.AAC.1